MHCMTTAGCAQMSITAINAAAVAAASHPANQLTRQGPAHWVVGHNPLTKPPLRQAETAALMFLTRRSSATATKNPRTKQTRLENRKMMASQATPISK